MKITNGMIRYFKAVKPGNRLTGKRVNRATGQTTAEIGVLVFVVVAALIAVQAYMKRGIQGKLRAGSDNIGEQYDPVRSSSDFTVSHRSTTLTTSTTDTGTGAVDGEARTLTSSTVDMISDNSTKSGTQIVQGF